MTSHTGRVIEDIARVLTAGPALVLSGAGMSTDSGIPDYRGPDGGRRVRPMDYADLPRRKRLCFGTMPPLMITNELPVCFSSAELNFIKTLSGCYNGLRFI